LHAGLYVDKTKAPEFKDVLLITSSNMGYLDMLENWQCHADRLGLDYVVLSMDEQLHEHIGYDRSMLVEGKKTEGAARFGSPEFVALACQKIRAVLDIIVRTNLDVVFTDCDNVFKYDPFASQYSLGRMMRSGNYEYIYGRKSRPPGAKASEWHVEQDKANTGFYYVAGKRKAHGVQHIFGQGVHWCKKRPNLDDQENFWDALIQIKKGKEKHNPDAFKCFRHCGAELPDTEDRCQDHDEGTVFNYCDMSPLEYVEGSTDARAADKMDSLVAYHSNWVFGKHGKVDKLKGVHLWDKSCLSVPSPWS